MVEHMRTRRNFLAVFGTAAVTWISGCGGNSSGETSTEVHNLEDIYDDHMVGDGNAIESNWKHIQSQLDEEYEEKAELVEDLAIQIDGELPRPNNAASELAYALKEKYGYSVGEIMVDARNIMGGVPEQTVAVYLTDHPGISQEQTQILQWMPWDDTENEHRILKPHEQDIRNTETTFLDAFSSDGPDWTSSIFDLDGTKRRETISNGKIVDPEGWNRIDNLTDNIILGYMSETAHGETGDGSVNYTPEAWQRIDTVMNIEQINNNPGKIGNQARKLTENSSKYFYNNVAGKGDEYLEIDYNPEAGEFVFDTVDHETHEQNIRESFPEYTN